MRQLCRICLMVLGVLLVPASIVPWILSVALALAGPGEVVSVRETGMVSCPELLSWTDWIDGPGDVYCGMYVQQANLREAEIVAHRIGTDSRVRPARLAAYIASSAALINASASAMGVNSSRYIRRHASAS